MVQLDVQLLTMLAGLVVPLVVGLVTRAAAPRWVKTVANFLLSAVAGGLVVAIEANGSVELKTWLVNMAVAFFTSVTAHYHLWKPQGVTSFVQGLAPRFGITGNRLTQLVNWAHPLSQMTSPPSERRGQ